MQNSSPTQTQKSIWLLLTSITLVLLYYNIIYLHELETGIPRRIAPIAQSGLMWIFWYIYYIFGKAYCIHVEELEIRTILKKLFEHGILPLASMLFPIFLFIDLESILKVLSNGTSLILMTIVIFLTMDTNHKVCSGIKSEPIWNGWSKPESRQLLFLSYPPKSRIDLVPQEFLMFICIVLAILCPPI